MTIDHIKGSRYESTTTNEKGEASVMVVSPERGYYALLPLTVPADIALTPFYLLWAVYTLVVYGSLPY